MSLHRRPWYDQLVGQANLLLQLGDLIDGYGCPPIRMPACADAAVEGVVYVTREDVPSASISCFQELGDY
jgi:hypothetical protein